MEDVPSLRLTAKQETAAKLIARGWTKAEVARDPRVDVTKTTMQRWTLENEAFMKRVADLRTSVDLRATEILQDQLDNAARVMALAISGEHLDVDARCKKCGAGLVCAGECGEDAEPSANMALKDRVAAAKWLLDLHYKGKISQGGKQDSARDEDDETLDSIPEDELEELMERGVTDEDDPFEHDEV